MNQVTHIIRALAVLLLGIAGFFMVRSFFVPESFGVQDSYIYGYYRADSEGEQARREALYQGSNACCGCHSKAAAGWKEGRHAGVPCETCHGICRAGKNEAGVKPVSDSSIAACMKCHVAIQGRPAGFPQVASLDVHVQEKVKWGCQVGPLVSVDNRRDVKQKEDVFAQGLRCVLCHDAHHPLLKLKDFAMQKAERERLLQQTADNQTGIHEGKP
jgi:hypothetical protein